MQSLNRARTSLTNALRKKKVKYRDKMYALQVAMVEAQFALQLAGKRVIVLFEGRDAAGKSGTLRRVTWYLNPRATRIIALPIASTEENTQLYFQRYIKHFPSAGEIVFFDRSWYNRAIVEPVNGLCTPEEYLRFMQEVPTFEHLLALDGIQLIKMWFDVSKDEQAKRIQERKDDPLKAWKVTPIDMNATALWDKYTEYEAKMFKATDATLAPWIRIDANDKKQARLDALSAILGATGHAITVQKRQRPALPPAPATPTMLTQRQLVQLDNFRTGLLDSGFAPWRVEALLMKKRTELLHYHTQGS